MKHFLILLFSITTSRIYCQHNPDSNTVSFITKFKKEYATKDGYYLNNYVVDINSDLAKKLDGKKIKITGKYYIVKGVKDKYEQGRLNDTKHISSPKIEIVE